MWVWIGAAHDVAFVLKYLDPLVRLAQLVQLLHPRVNYYDDVIDSHKWEGQIGVRVETHHTTVRERGLMMTM